MELDPKTDTSLDKYHLDDEAKALPSIVGRYHDEIYRISEELADMEFELEKEEAVARRDVRAKFSANGVKATIDMVNDEVCCLQAIVQMRKDVAHRKTQISYLKGVLSALEAKKASINNLTSLYIKDYFMTRDDGSYKEADVKHGLGIEYDNMAEKQTRKLADAMRRR